MSVHCYQPNGIDSPNTTNTRETPFADTNMAVDVIVLADHRVSLPPIRPLWQANPHTHALTAPAPTPSPTQTTTPTQTTPTSSVGSTKPLARSALLVADDTPGEPFDPSIDDTPQPQPQNTNQPPTTTATLDAACCQPARKKAKCDRSPSNQPPPSTSTSFAPSAAASGPAKLSFAGVNQPRENARQDAEWISEVHPALVAYVVTLSDIPGKFDVAKAKELGIPPGPLYAKLKAGETVQIRKSDLQLPGMKKKQQVKQPKQQQQKKNANAQATTPDPAPTVVESAAADASSSSTDDPLLTFHPSDCVGKPTAGPKFVVVDCPNIGLIPNVVDHPAFNQYRDIDGHATPNKRIMVMLHMAPLAVIATPAYTAWMESFGSTTQHILAHATTSIPKPIFRSAALNYIKMREWICDKVFPANLPQSGSSALEDARVKGVLDSAFKSGLRDRLHPACTLLKFHLLAGRKEISGIDRAELAADITPAELNESLAESSNPAGIEKLNRWRQAMKDGIARGESISSIAHAVKCEFDSASMVDADSCVPSVSPPLENDLQDPPSLPSFTPDPDVLSKLAAQDDQHSPHMLFLGTGSAIPSKYRNVTGQLFHPGYVKAPAAGVSHPIGSILLDCGEGSYGQLCLRYHPPAGFDQSSKAIVDNLIADLKAVWISHIHADHHLGLLTVLAAYRQTWLKRYTAARTAAGDQQVDHQQIDLVAPHSYTGEGHQVPKLLIVGPRRLYFWLKEYAACAFHVGEEDQFTPVNSAASSSAAPPSSSSSHRTLFHWVEFVTCSEMMDRDHTWSDFFASEHPAIQRRYADIHTRPINVFQTVQVKHCADAYGLIVESQPIDQLPALKVVVSGDTQPCQALLDAGADATLLVHEATLEDDMIQEALEKRHSTTKQAIEVGIQMRAARILLTHFSQRYPKIPTYSDHFSSRTSLAFDLMEIRFNQLQWLPALTPAFAWMFDADKLKKYVDEDGAQEETSQTRAH